MITLSFIRSVVIPHALWLGDRVHVDLVGVHPDPERVVRRLIRGSASTPRCSARRCHSRPSSVRSVLRGRIAKASEEHHPGRRPDPPRDARRNHYRRPRRHRNLLRADNHDTLTIQEVERCRRPRVNRQGLPNAEAYENHLQLRRLVQQSHPRPVLGEGNCAAPIRPYRHALPPSSRGHVLVNSRSLFSHLLFNTPISVLKVAAIGHHDMCGVSRHRSAWISTNPRGWGDGATRRYPRGRTRHHKSSALSGSSERRASKDRPPVKPRMPAGRQSSVAASSTRPWHVCPHGPGCPLAATPD